MIGLVIAILILNTLDLCFTLGHIYWAEGQEINPLLNYVLQNYGVTIFISIKMLVTTFAVFYLLYLGQFIDWVEYALWSIVILYAILIVYHVVLAVRFW